MKAITEPLVVVPRLDPKPWGGQRLARFGFHLDSAERIGEAVLTSNDVLIAGGSFAGKMLGEVLADEPELLLGGRGMQMAGNRSHFPLLVKLIDAQENLSIQVHPDNVRAPDGTLGKSEAWYVLEAQPGSSIFAGLREGVTEEVLRQRLEQGQSIITLLIQHQVAVGDVIYLPAGTIHALGAGIVVYEIQQQSATTYRLEDWGRDRELHINQGLAVLDLSSRPVARKTGSESGTGANLSAVMCEHFALDVLQIHPGTQTIIPPQEGPQVYTCVSGTAELSVSRSDVALPTGTTAILFAHAGPARLASLGGARVLRGWLGS